MNQQGILHKIIKPSDCVLAFGVPTCSDDFRKDLDSRDKDFAKTVAGGWFQYKSQFLSILNKAEPLLKKMGVRIVHRLTIDNLGELLINERTPLIILFTHWLDEPNTTIFNKVDFLNFLEKHPDFLTYVPHHRQLLTWVSQSSRVLSRLAKTQIATLDNKVKPLVEFDGDVVKANYDKIVFDYLVEIETGTYLELLKYSRTSEVEFYDGLRELYKIVEMVPEERECFLDLNVCSCRDLTVALSKCRPRCHFKYKNDGFGAESDFGVRPDSMLYFYVLLFKYLAENNCSYLHAFQAVFARLISEKRRMNWKN